MNRFEGQVAIVTGGALGIGGATARKFASEGARVLIADIDMHAALANTDDITAAGGVAQATMESGAARYPGTECVWRRVDPWRLARKRSNRHRRDVGERNVCPDQNALSGAKYAVPKMAKSGGGNIVNLASVHGFLMASKMLIYEAGKAAVIGMTKQMAIDFGPEGIRVNAICPVTSSRRILRKCGKATKPVSGSLRISTR